MLATILALLRTKTGQYLIAGVLGAAIFGGYTYYIYHKGGENATLVAEAKYKKLYDNELARQLEVQDKVINSQKQIIAALVKSEAEIDAKLKENESEASKDPNGSNISLSSDAVMRINRIK